MKLSVVAGTKRNRPLECSRRPVGVVSESGLVELLDQRRELASRTGAPGIEVANELGMRRCRSCR